MSKSKRGKSGSASEVVRWETELIQASFSEDDWKPMVIFLAPNISSDNEVVSVLSETIKSGLRKLYSVVDYDQLLIEVKEIVAQSKGSKGKGAAVGKSPQYIEICEIVKNLLDQGETLPVLVLAKLIKFKLLLIKNKDLERREAERKAASSNSKTKIDGNRSQSKSPNRAKSVSPGKGGKKGAKKDEKPVSPKKDTKLKKRGEESEAFKTIDDEPDGPTDPQHYIILTGFTDAALLSSLIEIKVITNAIIKLKTDYHIRLDEIKNKSMESENIEEPTFEEEENLRKVYEEERKFEESLIGFWENSDLLVKHAPTGHPLRNIAKFDVIIKEDCLPEQLLDAIEPELKMEFGTWLFDKVADVCYDMLDYLQQYKRYIENLKIIDVSALGKPKIAKKLSTLSDGGIVSEINVENSSISVVDVKPPTSDLRYYDKLMSNVPIESESVPLILDCLLEQVVANTDGPNPMDIVPPPREDGLSHIVGSYLDRQLVIFGIGESKKIWKNDDEKATTPGIVYHGDERRNRLLNMSDKSKEFDAQKIEDRMRGFHPYTNFMKYLQPSEEEWMENCIRRLQLYNFCRKKHPISEEKFERAMRQYIFESLPLETAMDSGTHTIDAIDEQLEKIVSRWDDPYYDVQQMLSDANVQREVSEESVETFCLRKLDHYNWLERLEQSVLFQVLDNGSDLRPYLDTYYNRGNNTLLVVLHNPSNDNMNNNFTWESWLHSDIGFRNYLEHVAIEIQEWTVEQERAEEECKKQQIPQETDNPSPIPQPVKERSRWGMKTRVELAEEIEIVKDGDKRKKSAKSRSRSASPKKSGKSPEKKKSEVKQRKASPKRSRQGTASKRPTSTNVSFNGDTENSVESAKEDYPFIGYNLGDNLLHISVDQSYLFPQNGSLVKIEKLCYIDQNNSVQITVMNNGDTFTVNFVNPIVMKEEDLKDENEMKEGMKLPLIRTSYFDEYNGCESKQEEEEGTETELPSLPELKQSICSYSSITGTFGDGMIIAFSSSVQKNVNEESLKVNNVVSEISKESTETTSAPKSAKGKKGKKDDDSKLQEENERLQKEADTSKLLERQQEIVQALKDQQSSLNLYVTTPNGMHASFKHNLLLDDIESIDEAEQTFVLKLQQFSNDREEITLENHDVVKELYRCVTDNGLVIKYNSDETVEILSPDGDIYHSTPYTEDSSQVSNTVASTKNDVQEQPSISPTRPQSKKANKQTKPNSTEESISTVPTVLPDIDTDVMENVLPVEWHVLSGNGEQRIIKRTNDEEYLDDLLISDATCFDTNQVLRTREDGVMVLMRPDGSKVVEYLDGTRITTCEECHFSDVINQETGENEGTIEQTSTVIKVEHDAYPTTVVDASQSSINIVYNNGKNIKAFRNGGYNISKDNKNEIFIHSSGGLYIYPNSSDDVISKNNLPSCDMLGNNCCVIRQTLKDCVCLVDDNGNKFKVNANGDYTVNKIQSEVLKEEEGISPRYFVIYPDGSGEELLRYEDVDKYLHDAEQQSSAALIHANVEGNEDATAVTVIKPHKGKPSQIWKSKKEVSNIIPISLRERDFKTFPAKEEKKAGPKFGTRISCNTKAKSVPIPSCPDTLEIRHLINYKELTSDLRNEIIGGINNYGDYVHKQQEEQDRLKITDERNQEEKLAAEKIKEKYNIKEKSDCAFGFVADVANKAAEEILAEQYTDAITPAPLPQKRCAKPERSQSEWDKDKRELNELEHAKSVIRSKEFPPYFKTEEGQSYLYKSGILPNMEELTRRLAEETKHPIEGRTSFICSTPSEETKDNPFDVPVASSTPHMEDSSYCIDMSSSLSMKYDISSSSISPHISNMEPDSSFGAGRPLNPTPMKAGTIVSFVQTTGDESKLETIDETNPDFIDDRDVIGNKSLVYDVSGSLRTDKVKTPISILGSRPNAVPNEKFSTIEEPVRRQIRTASVHGAVNPDVISKLRGFILLPDLVNFGILREGYSYISTIVMKNVGVDACRFKIKQPPPSTGLKIIYKPGAVAAGMEVTFDIEIFALAVGCEGTNGIGKISHPVEITTETDVLYLPVLATVVTQYEFDNPSDHTPRGGPSKGILVINDRPTSRESLTRPRKE